MKVEMFAKGPIEQVLKDNNIAFSKTYSSDTYKIIELEKQDAKYLCNGEVDMNGAWCMISNGAGGSLFDFVTINNESLIGWNSKKDSYDKLIDYLKDIGAKDDDDICHYASGLARANGMSLSRLFSICGG